MHKLHIFLGRTVFFAIFLVHSLAWGKYTQEELSYLPAVELLKLFRAQEVSPVEVLKAQIERIETHDGKINAITMKHYEEAMNQARESEERYKQGSFRTLEGLTCAIKDDTEVKGWRSVMGSLIRKEAPVAKEDSALAAVLRAAGVVMHVQTNVPEYYCNLVTWNRIYGVCRNPWNLDYTPGGSSGGSAAALVSGFTTLAIGSDMGGSIRFPAAMTGLYGFKPPYGRVPTSLVQYESSGPMTRTFEDLNVFQNVISGPQPLMLSSLRPKLEYPEHYGDIKGWKIAYDPMDKWGVPVDQTIKEAMVQMVTLLRSLGAEVVEVDLGFRANDFEKYALGIFSTSIGPFCFTEARQHPELITAYIAYLDQKYYSFAAPPHIEEAEGQMNVYHKQVQERVFLKGYHAIIMPTMCTPYVAADMGSRPDNSFVVINGKEYKSETWGYSFTWPWNMLGQYPVVNVPIGITKENIPLGMQIISNTYDDLVAFQLASAVSKEMPSLFIIFKVRPIH